MNKKMKGKRCRLNKPKEHDFGCKVEKKCIANFLSNIDVSFFYYPIENSTAKHGIPLPHHGQAGIKAGQIGRLQEAA